MPKLRVVIPERIAGTKIYIDDVEVKGVYSLRIAARSRPEHESEVVLGIQADVEVEAEAIPVYTDVTERGDPVPVEDVTTLDNTVAREFRRRKGK